MKQVVLAAYAKGNPKAADFRVEEVPAPVAGDGEILLKVLYIAVDPLIRFSLDETFDTLGAPVSLRRRRSRVW